MLKIKWINEKVLRKSGKEIHLHLKLERVEISRTNKVEKILGECNTHRIY